MDYGPDKNSYAPLRVFVLLGETQNNYNFLNTVDILLLAPANSGYPLTQIFALYF